MPSDDRIDNKRILVFSPGSDQSKPGKEVLVMPFLSARVQLALVAVVSVVATVLLGSSHWGP
jgi:hypothetical protein